MGNPLVKEVVVEAQTQETALVAEIREITAAGHEVTVLNDLDYDLAGNFLNEIKEKEKAAHAFFDPMVKAAHKAHKEVKARENEVILPLVEAKKAVGAEMGRYQAEQEEKRRIEQERERVQLQKEADERALVEAERLAEIAKVEKEARLAEAARLDEAGEGDAATRMEEAARREEQAWLKESERALEDTAIVEPTVGRPAPKVQNTSVRTFWRYEIVDEAAIPREYMCVDERAIGATVRTRKGSTSIPGVRVYSETNVS